MPNDIEHQHQVQYFRLVRFFRDEPGLEDFGSICAIPNGGHRADRVAQKMQDEGVEPGVWDVLVSVPSSECGCSNASFCYNCSADTRHVQYGGLWIEFKAPGRRNEGNGRGKNKVVNGGLSDYQLAFATQQAERGFDLFVAYSWQEAWEYTKQYLGLTEVFKSDQYLRAKEALLCSM